MFRPLRTISILIGFAGLVVFADSAHGVVLLDVNFQDLAVDTTLDTVPNWFNPIPDSETETGGPPIVLEEEGGNRFLTTNALNSQPIRYALPFTNPGFFSGTTLTMTADMWDPFVNTQSSASTFPRVYVGIYELAGPSGMPPYFGIETNDENPEDDIFTGEWVLGGEGFTPRLFSSEGSVLQDTWYTVRSVWDFETGTRNLQVKLRGSADPFTDIFTDVPIDFEDPEQAPWALDTFQLRMLRGTRLDNILIEYDVVQPPPVDLDGDYNGDNEVNAADYVVWRDTDGSQSDLRADGDGSGTVDFLDYEFWRARFGNTAGSGSASPASSIVNVPEPATGLLAGVMWVAAIAGLRRRRTVA